jgi:hypothetical protein
LDGDVDVDEACLAVGMVAREGSFQVGEGTWAEAGGWVLLRN